jgi:hypothetical protein
LVVLLLVGVANAIWLPMIELTIGQDLHPSTPIGRVLSVLLAAFMYVGRIQYGVAFCLALVVASMATCAVGSQQAFVFVFAVAFVGLEKALGGLFEWQGDGLGDQRLGPTPSFSFRLRSLVRS